MLAFQAIVDGITQVGVMRPGSGTWTILTRDRSQGIAQEMAWSADNSRIYFDRYVDAPRGIFSVPVLGGDERLLLENAMTPQVLPDGSLLVTRINAERLAQLHRFWPETGRIEPLPALTPPISRLPLPAVRVFPGGREAVFVGRPMGSTDAEHLWVIDLKSGRTRRIAPDVTLAFGSWSFPLAVSADGQSVLFIVPSGDLQRVVMVPRDGSAGVRTLLTLTYGPVALDVSADGSLYADQLDSPSEILRFVPSTRALERMPLPATHVGGPVLPLRDGRMLSAIRTGGREKIVVLTSGKEPVPFIETQEETAAPIAALGGDSVVLLVGTPPNRKVAIASIADGRIIKRLTRVDGNQAIGSIAGSPDGATIFFVSGGMLWSTSAADGEPVKLRGADAVAIDREGLVVLLNEASGIRLVRRALPSGREQDVPIRGDVRLTPWPIAPNAVARDGRIALRVTRNDTWFWPAGILDPQTGNVDVLPGASTTDMLTPGWDSEDRLVTVAKSTRGTLWRFQPVGQR
jgi:eukaryotic-like serine/threonine-protein kinase